MIQFKVEDYSSMFSAPIKGRSPIAMLHCIARSMGTLEHETFTTQGKRIVELLLQLGNKQQIMQYNVQTQYSL